VLRLFFHYVQTPCWKRPFLNWLQLVTFVFTSFWLVLHFVQPRLLLYYNCFKQYISWTLISHFTTTNHNQTTHTTRINGNFVPPSFWVYDQITLKHKLWLPYNFHSSMFLVVESKGWPYEVPTAACGVWCVAFGFLNSALNYNIWYNILRYINL
jgi:hypothetical protein